MTRSKHDQPPALWRRGVYGAAIGAILTLAFVPALPLAQGRGGWQESTVIRVEAGPWTGPRLRDGQPDVQGHWSNTRGNHNNLTGAASIGDADDPPAAGRGAGRQGGQAVQGAPGEQSEGGRGAGRGGGRGAGAGGGAGRGAGGGGGGGRGPISRVSDPPDGQVPFQPWARAKADEFRRGLNNPTNPEYVEPFARCAPGGPTKSFMWHGYEIRQYPGYVVFLFDSGNRVIHLDGKPHLPENVKLWQGDSRGRWEGNTLVVDTTNNNSKWRFGRTGEFVSDQATVQERFTFASDRTRFIYDATYTDPTVLTRPFTISIPNKRITAETPQDDWNNITFFAVHDGKEPIIEAYERICAEGNAAHGDVALE